MSVTVYGPQQFNPLNQFVSTAYAPQLDRFVNTTYSEYTNPNFCSYLKNVISFVEDRVNLVFSTGMECLSLANDIFAKNTGCSLITPLFTLGSIATVIKGPALGRFLFRHPLAAASTVAAGSAYYGLKETYRNHCKETLPFIESEDFLDRYTKVLQEIKENKLMRSTVTYMGLAGAGLLDQQGLDLADYIIKHLDIPVHAVHDRFPFRIADYLSHIIGIKISGKQHMIEEYAKDYIEKYPDAAESFEKYFKSIMQISSYLINAIPESTILKLREKLGIKEDPSEVPKAIF